MGQILANATNISSGDLQLEIPYLTAIYDALDGIAAAYLVQDINTILNIRKNVHLKKMRELLEEINSKLGKKK